MLELEPELEAQINSGSHTDMFRESTKQRLSSSTLGAKFPGANTDNTTQPHVCYLIAQGMGSSQHSSTGAANTINFCHVASVDCHFKAGT